MHRATRGQGAARSCSTCPRPRAGGSTRFIGSGEMPAPKGPGRATPPPFNGCTPSEGSGSGPGGPGHRQRLLQRPLRIRADHRLPRLRSARRSSTSTSGATRPCSGTQKTNRRATEQESATSILVDDVSEDAIAEALSRGVADPPDLSDATTSGSTSTTPSSSDQGRRIDNTARLRRRRGLHEEISEDMAAAGSLRSTSARRQRRRFTDPATASPRRRRPRTSPRSYSSSATSAGTPTRARLDARGQRAAVGRRRPRRAGSRCSTPTAART